MIRATTNEIAGLLSKALYQPQLAGLLNALLTIEQDEAFTDRECEIGTALFDALCTRSPEAVELAKQA